MWIPVGAGLTQNPVSGGYAGEHTQPVVGKYKSPCNVAAFRAGVCLKVCSNRAVASPVDATRAVTCRRACCDDQRRRKQMSSRLHRAQAPVVGRLVEAIDETNMHLTFSFILFGSRFARPSRKGSCCDSVALGSMKVGTQISGRHGPSHHVCILSGGRPIRGEAVMLLDAPSQVWVPPSAKAGRDATDARSSPTTSIGVGP